MGWHSSWTGLKDNKDDLARIMLMVFIQGVADTVNEIGVPESRLCGYIMLSLSYSHTTSIL